MIDTFFSDTQVIDQLEDRKGGYTYLTIPATFVDTLEKGRNTRLICVIGAIEFQCGLNHLGNGDFFIILSKKNMKSIGAVKGDSIAFSLKRDPNLLGVEIPEVLEVLLEQDEELNSQWKAITDGKKRSVIHTINRIKNVDLQVNRSIELIGEAHAKTRRRHE